MIECRGLSEIEEKGKRKEKNRVLIPDSLLLPLCTIKEKRDKNKKKKKGNCEKFSAASFDRGIV